MHRSFSRPVEERARKGADRTSKTDPVRDKRAVAVSIGWRFHPFFMRVFKEDSRQEIDLLVWSHPEEMTLGEWSNLVYNHLYKVAKKYGIKRGRGDRVFFKKEIPVAFLPQDGRDDRLQELRIQVLLGVEEWPEVEMWLVEAFEFCRNIFAGEDGHINTDAERADWALFLAWLQGWSYPEIRFAFGINGNLKVELMRLAQKIRVAAGVDPDLPILLPPRGPKGLQKRLEDSMEAGDSPVPTRPRYILPPNLSAKDIQKAFWVSRTTAWRARKRGWLVPGFHIPDPAGKWHGELKSPETVVDLSKAVGRRFTKRQILGRDGWWVEFGAMWTRCGLCGEPVLVSMATIDHIYPKSEGGSNQLGNLHLSHEKCNKMKGSNLPSLAAAGLQKK